MNTDGILKFTNIQETIGDEKHSNLTFNGSNSQINIKNCEKFSKFEDAVNADYKRLYHQTTLDSQIHESNDDSIEKTLCSKNPAEPFDMVKSTGVKDYLFQQLERIQDERNIIQKEVMTQVIDILVDRLNLAESEEGELMINITKLVNKYYNCQRDDCVCCINHKK
ncbi:DgyrCDS3935 [Dimorphilus gyrociliatus]|uniref:DgyrCDS3935 n=1 Tax=Dimorphilus gyrociliatus TaxID=2664684 RepID=A0A7I8VJZ8_9ANNE|nr:DgyrCDS3935 [Dimorphilus gyrociliatus]